MEEAGRMHRSRKLAIVGGLAATTLLALASVPAAADTSTLFSQNPVDGWGQDGTAYTVAMTSTRVYAGGKFMNAVRFAQSEQHVNLMAVDRATGVVVSSFQASTDNTVRAMATDGTALYIGGDFTMVNGAPRNHLAKLDLDGNLDGGWSVDVPKTVRDLLVVGNKLYLVGDFGTVDGTVRKRAAAVDKGSGQLDTNFNPNLGGKAYAVAAFGSTVYLGGNFLTVGGASRSYLAAVDATSGALQDPVFKNVGDVILDLSVNTDTGKQVFGAGGGGFNSAAAWNTDPAAGADFGRRQWVQRADGDVQAVRFAHKNGPSGVGNVYFGFHDGFGGNIKLRLLAADAATGALMWPPNEPVSGGNPGVVALDTDGVNLVAGGRFPKIGTVNVKGLSIHA
jgi:hypothetical protein